MWLLALMYVCILINHLASATLGWKPPLRVLTGQTPDISAFLHFSFFDPVYYHAYSDTFPSTSNEAQGWWVGIATHVGDALTYKILIKEHKVIYRSATRSALDPAKRNQRLTPFGGETSFNHHGDKIFIRYKAESPCDMSALLDDSDPNVKHRMVTIDPKDLIGRTFLKDSEDDGQRICARVVRAVFDKEEAIKKVPENMRLIFEVPESSVDEILTYNEILDHIEKDNNDIENDTENLYEFRRISTHQCPLRSSDMDYKGSLFNVLVEWETEETTYEPLDLIASDDPVTCAAYAVKHGLIDTPCWRRFKRYAKNQKKIDHMINQAKLLSYR
jgi:hypothetical protein